MDEITSTSFQLLYHRLPQRVKDILLAPKTGDDIYAACQKHSVEKRVYVYSGLVGMVLLGELHPNLLVRNIVETEHIDVEKAKALALDISVAVFQPIKSDLISLYGINSPGATATKNISAEPQTQQTKPVPVPPPSTRPSGTPLPPMPSASIDAFYVKPPSISTEQINGSLSQAKSFYSPQPNTSALPRAPENQNGRSPIDQNHGPQLDGNVVNLKEIGNKPSL